MVFLGSINETTTKKLIILIENNKNESSLFMKCYNSTSCIILVICLPILILLALFPLIHNNMVKTGQKNKSRESGKDGDIYKKRINNRYFKTNY
jgi:hypothetical protein